MRQRRETIKEGSSKTLVESYVLEQVQVLHVALKKQGAQSPGIAALMAYNSLINHPETPNFHRWVYLYRTTKLKPGALKRALKDAGFTGAS